MNKKVLKVITVLFTIVFVLSINLPVIFAADTPGDVSITDTTTADNVGKQVLGVIRGVGTLISVGVIMVLGIKYMMGSAEEKAEYKKTMIPYVIGAILLFAAVNIATAIFNFGNTIG